MRWAILIVGILVAAIAGLLVGYARWGTVAARSTRVEQQLHATESEATALRTQNQDLAQRLDQVTKEQQRLAQENEILRKQDTTERLLSGQKGELPELPPK